MPVATYDLIEEKVLSSGTTSVTFSSIPGTYKNLVLEVVGNSEQSGSALNGMRMRINSDTGTNYSYLAIYADSSTASSYATGNADYIDVGSLGQTSSLPTPNTIQIMSYANTNVNKTLVSQYGKGGTISYGLVGCWRSTSAVTSILLYRDLTINLKTGTIFRLWGVAG